MYIKNPQMPKKNINYNNEKTNDTKNLLHFKGRTQQQSLDRPSMRASERTNKTDEMRAWLESVSGVCVCVDLMSIISDYFICFCVSIRWVYKRRINIITFGYHEPVVSKS